jgi:hypothetical protein
MKRLSDDESYEEGRGWAGGTLVFFGKVSPSSNRHLCSNDGPTNPSNIQILYIVCPRRKSQYTTRS